MSNVFGNSTSWGDRKRAALSQRQRTGTAFSQTPNAIGTPTLPSFMTQGQGMSPEDAAVAQGYLVKGNQAVMQHGKGGPGSYQSYTPISAFNQGSTMNPTGGGGGQMQEALLQDTQTMQGAADEQWGANQQQIDALSMLLEGVPGRIAGPAQAGAGQLREFAGQAASMGQEQGRQVQGAVDKIGRGVDSILQRGDPSADIAAAYALSDEAATGFQDAIAQYQDMGAQEASAMASAIRRQGHSAMKMATAGIHPDGSPMTASEQAAAVAQVQFDTESQVQESITPVLSRFNDTMVTLRKSLADLKMGGAQTRLAGGELRSRSSTERAGMAAQAGYQGLNAVMQSHEGQRQLLELGANLHQAATSLENAAVLNSVNLEMQGRTAIAQLVQQNPRSVVSWLQGLLAIAAAQAATSPEMGGGSSVPRGTQQATTPQATTPGQTPGRRNPQAREMPSGQGMTGYNRRTQGSTPVRTPKNTSWVQGPTRS